MFRELDHVLSMKEVYDSRDTDQVSQLKQMYDTQARTSGNTPELRFEKNKALAGFYQRKSLDSTMNYLSKNRLLARRMKDSTRLIETDLAMALIYSKAGFYLETTQIMDRYRPEIIPATLIPVYHQTIYYIAGELSHYSAEPHNLSGIKTKYREILLSEYPEKSYEWYDVKKDMYIIQHKTEDARRCALEMVSKSLEGTNRYAQAAYFVSRTYDEGSMEEMEWLIRSAISDVMSSTKDYVSLNKISKLLFEAGDIDRAFRYSADYCLPDAMSYNGRLRQLQLAEFFPEIQKEYQIKSDNQRTIRNHYIIALCVMLAILCLMVIIIFIRQRILIKTRNLLQESYAAIENQNSNLVKINGKLQKVNQELQDLNKKILESDHVKQEYISLFLSILSENISTTRQYSNHVLKCIRHGKTKDLENEINAMPPIEDDINRFYKMFDQTFINMYPNFIEQFNDLLIDGKEMHPKAGEILCPEQRIFALIKLGINDSSKIASLLHYSTSTIYNYKVKTKNRARKDRNNFEQAVRDITG